MGSGQWEAGKTLGLTHELRTSTTTGNENSPRTRRRLKQTGGRLAASCVAKTALDTQVGLAHLVVAGHLTAGTLYLDPALGQNVGVVGEGQRQVDVLLH